MRIECGVADSVEVDLSRHPPAQKITRGCSCVDAPALGIEAEDVDLGRYRLPVLARHGPRGRLCTLPEPRSTRADLVEFVAH
jgi:hypothetical protein